MEQSVKSISGLLKSNKGDNLIWKPEFFRLDNGEDREAIYDLLQQPGIKISDELQGQLRELVKLKYPTHKFTPEELDDAATKYLDGLPAEEYGVWVYYPWLNHLVHILDKEEYRNVRTNRNQFKITPEERGILATKTIGVLGLSVGQSVAIALSMERCFGEMRIADFDVLELSNLNRIRSGLQDLGLLKTVSTARQIAEIDPYLNVVPFHEGLTEENLDTFFKKGGKLDLIIDECDGLDIKILARHKAKELRVPVVMETSDRGMIDIERFDLEPDRSIMHGLIDHLDLDPVSLKGLSNEEKLPYILPMVGLDTMSDRLKASMLEIEQSITTWPQLASDVILGGAVSANVCRRIFLNQFHTSGRFFVDINEIVSEKSLHQADLTANCIEQTAETEIEEEVKITNLAVEETQINLTKQQVETLVEAAIWAPTGGNSQPWKWVYENKNLYLALDKSRATAFLDYESAGAYLGLGAATENLILKAHAMGLEVTIETFPEKDNNRLVALFRFFESTSSTNSPLEDHTNDHLVDAIKTRLTNRLLRDRKNIEAQKLFEIQNIGQSIGGAEVKLLKDHESMLAIGELIAKVDRIMITNKAGHHGFVSEIRWNDEEAARTKDGVDIATVDLSAGEAAGFRMAKNWSVVKTLNKWRGGSVFEKLSRKCIAGASAIGLITMPDADSPYYYNAGRALERLWLFANKNNVALQPMTALPFMLHRLTRGKGEGLTDGNIQELEMIREKFFQIFNLDEKNYPIFLFRLLVAEDPKIKSQRRPVEKVLVYKGWE